jgi:hypothetical protein
MAGELIDYEAVLADLDARREAFNTAIDNDSKDRVTVIGSADHSAMEPAVGFGAKRPKSFILNEIILT